MIAAVSSVGSWPLTLQVKLATVRSKCLSSGLCALRTRSAPHEARTCLNVCAEQAHLTLKNSSTPRSSCRSSRCGAALQVASSSVLAHQKLPCGSAWLHCGGTPGVPGRTGVRPSKVGLLSGPGFAEVLQEIRSPMTGVRVAVFVDAERVIDGQVQPSSSVAAKDLHWYRR